MILGKVVGSVWSTKKQPQLTGLKFLLVVPVHLTGLPDHPAGHESGLVDFCRKYAAISLSPELAAEARSVFSRTTLKHARKQLKELLSHNGFALDENKYDMILSFLAGSGEGIVVIDRLDAGIGDTVVVAFGKAARVGIGDQNMPIEAAVVAIVDEIELFS